MKRREFLTLPLGVLLAPLASVSGETSGRTAAYVVDVSFLYGAQTLRLTGTIDESREAAAGRYAVRIVGQGSGIANRIESSGIFTGGRWTPLRTASWFEVRGRESRSDVTYDYGRRMIEYHARSETFLLRRLRVVDDTLPIPEMQQVDDVISATLNYADGQWTPAGDGRLHTHVVRRRRREGEGPDEVEKTYRAELAPFVLQIAPDPATGKPSARFDLTRFSSWAREDRPAHIIFGEDRRPELITSSMILGTSIAIRMTGS